MKLYQAMSIKNPLCFFDMIIQQNLKTAKDLAELILIEQAAAYEV